MYKFKELKKGALLYIGGIKNMEFSIIRIISVENINGYLKIECEGKYNNGVILFIPINHINANNVIIGKNMIFANAFKWSEYVTDMIKRNAVCSVRFGFDYIL